ncbi:prostate and testis expressed protein 14-like [Loxodonta africana]|uniref:prostate and testis expressed protein 14-like n=1 Tax=Loxodonta africana TaxID=9785 RepID=UPI0030D5FDF5
MGKCFLLLLLGLSLLLGLLQGLHCCFKVEGSYETIHKPKWSLRCFRCFSVRPDGSCVHRRTTCNAKKNEECLLMKYYNDYRLFRGYQNCRYNCTNATISHGTSQTVNSCCKENDLCNRMENLGT